MRFLLDTDICTALLRDDPNVFQKCMQYSGQRALSTVVVGELLVVTKKTPRSVVFQAGLAKLIAAFHKLSYDIECAKRFGVLRGWLLDRGLPAPSTDVMIAATALEHDLILVTHNVRHFETVPDLRVDDWLANGHGNSNETEMARDPYKDLHPPPDDRYTDEEWAAELARRIEEVKSGRAEIISWEVARQRIKEAGEQALRLNRSQE